MKTNLHFNHLFALFLFMGFVVLSSCEKEEPDSSSSSIAGDTPEEDVVFSGSQTWSYDIEGDTLMLSFGYEGTRNTQIRGNLVVSVAPGHEPNHIRQVSFVLDGECIRIFSDSLGMSGSYSMEDLILEEGSHYFLTEVYTTNNDEMRNIKYEGTDPVRFVIGTPRILCRNINFSYPRSFVNHEDGLTTDSISIGIEINGNTCDNIDIRCRIHHALFDSHTTPTTMSFFVDDNLSYTYISGNDTNNSIDTLLFYGTLDQGRHIIKRELIWNGLSLTSIYRFYV